MASEHIYEEHVHQFGERLKEAVALSPAERDDVVEEKIAEVFDPFARDSSREELEREVASRLSGKTAAQELGMALLRQSISDLDDAPRLDLDQFITSARNG